MVSRGLTEYLQIDLLQMHAITALRTQGRFGKGQGREYSEAYVVQYWRPGFVKWERWKNTQGKEVSNKLKDQNFSQLGFQYLNQFNRLKERRLTRIYMLCIV